MFKQNWRASMALLLTISLSPTTLLPLVAFEQPAAAGLFSQQNSVPDRLQNRAGRIQAGTTVQVGEPNAKRIVLKPDETMSVTLETREPIRSDMGTVLIPRGTRIEGEFRPAEDGTRFVAKRILLDDGTERRLDASTNVVNYRKTISGGANTAPIWQGALVGGAASAAISSLVTKPGVFKTLAGAGAGALAGWLIAGRNRSTDVIVVRPKGDLTLTLNSDLVLRDRF